MEQKKPTIAQLQKRIAKAIIHIDRTKETQSIFFDDTGLRLTVNEDYAIIETNFHRHVFNSWTSAGISRPYLYTKRIIGIANENDCSTNNGYSFAKLLAVLKSKEDKADYNTFVYFSWYLHNIFSPLYSIGETEVDSFLVYEEYLHHIARNSVLLSEKTEDVTNKKFVEQVMKNMQEFIEGFEEHVIFPKKTDEEVMRENVEAAQKEMTEQAMEAQMDGAE